MTRETVGKISTDMLKNSHENTHSAHDQMKEMLTDYEKNIHEAIVAGCKKYTSDFFVVVLVKQERLMKNVMRNYYFARESCPTPQHDQVVYQYHPESGSIEFLWVVPSLTASVTMVNEALMAHPEERQLLQFVLDFRDGTLDRKAMELNGEFKEVNKVNVIKEISGTIEQPSTSGSIILPS